MWLKTCINMHLNIKKTSLKYWAIYLPSDYVINPSAVIKTFSPKYNKKALSNINELSRLSKAISLTQLGNVQHGIVTNT